MNEKWCSVIIPVYNVSEYIVDCVMSVINQKSKGTEIILVDDGSTDKSGIICDDLASKYSCIRVIHKQNGGLSDARNVGLKTAIGQYILFVDGDDYIVNNSLKKIHKCIIKYNNPDIVCLECEKFYPNSNTVIPMNDGITEVVNGLKGDKLFSYFANLPKYPASACTKALNRQFLLNNSLYFKKGLLSEDLEWAMRLYSSISKVAYCSCKYYMYRQLRVGSISNTVSEKNVLDLLLILVKGTELADNLSESSKKKMICSFCEYVFRLIVLHYGQVSQDNQKKVKSALIKRSWVLGSRIDLTSKIFTILYKLFGIEFTSIILKRYLMIREKKSKI